MELSEKRVELECKLKHLAEMRERVNAFLLYPDGAIMEEWTAICEKTLPDWKKAVLLVETLAAEYKGRLRGPVGNARYVTGCLGGDRGNGQGAKLRRAVLPPVFTVGLDSSRLVVSKGDYIRLAGIENPFTGQAL